MRISLRLRLYTSKTYADGKHPIVMQYTTQGKVKRKVIASCLPDDWDPNTLRVKGKCKNSTQINRLISTTFSKAEKDLYEIKTGDKPVRALFEPPTPVTFDEAMALELQRLQKEMKAGAYSKLISYSHQIKSFSKNACLLLKDMDLVWFKSFAGYLQEIGNEGITTHKKVKSIRALVTRYLGKDKVSEELKSFRIQTKKSVKQKLTAEELLRIEELEMIEDDSVTISRDLFLLQIYLRGIRIGDLLQAYSEQFKEGVFTYIDDKTGQTFKIKIISKAQLIIDKYINQHDRLFPVFKWQRNPKLNAFENKFKRLKEKESCTAVVNRNLKIVASMAEIDKPLSSHIARHTFARMAIDKINNPMITMELLGHSSLAVHQQYLNDIRKDDELDRAADDIFS
jgi:integrase/recombinase XerD